MTKGFKIISLNIEFNKHLDLIIPFFQKENADVLLLQEVLEEDLEFFREKLQMNFVFAPLSKIKFHDGIKTLGIATFSKFKIVESSFICYRGSSKTIPVIDRTEPEKMNRGILKTFVQKDSQTFCLVNNYFTWTPDGNPNLTQRVDLKKLLKLLSQIPEFVMCGDFNAPRGKEIFDALAKVYKDNIPQEVTTTIDGKLHYAGDLQLVVDGLFTTKGYEVKDVRIVSSMSDHCAVIATIV